MSNIKISVIGCGYWGKNLVRNFAQLGALYSVCDANQELTTRASQDYGVPIHTFDQVLQSNIDGVVIAVPAAQHYTLTKQALKAGKHVFVEKPLSLNFFVIFLNEEINLISFLLSTILTGPETLITISPFINLLD